MIVVETKSANSLYFD